MSMFQGISAIGRSLALKVHARTISFQPRDPDADVESVMAVVGTVDADLVQGEDTLHKQQLRRIEVPISASEGGPSERARGGVYTIDGEAWTVITQESINSQTGLATLLLSRPLRMDSGGRADRTARSQDR